VVAALRRCANFRGCECGVEGCGGEGCERGGVRCARCASIFARGVLRAGVGMGMGARVGGAVAVIWHVLLRVRRRTVLARASAARHRRMHKRERMEREKVPKKFGKFSGGGTSVFCGGYSWHWHRRNRGHYGSSAPGPDLSAGRKMHIYMKRLHSVAMCS
jgi:hypothetical protein